jgi:hypothetical protein
MWRFGNLTSFLLILSRFLTRVLPLVACSAWIFYAFVPFFTSDIAVLIFCGLYFASGGFLNSITYGFVRTTVSEPRLLTKAAALVNLMLQTGCIVAVSISFVIKTMVPLPDHVLPHPPS